MAGLPGVCRRRGLCGIPDLGLASPGGGALRLQPPWLAMTVAMAMNSAHSFALTRSHAGALSQSCNGQLSDSVSKEDCRRRLLSFCHMVARMRGEATFLHTPPFTSHTWPPRENFLKAVASAC